jgi:hypothetical protein
MGETRRKRPFAGRRGWSIAVVADTPLIVPINNLWWP